jgi:hypothetical protein
MSAMDHARREHRDAGDTDYDSDEEATKEDKEIMGLCALVRTPFGS